ncbi:ATPase involved in DNA repair/chromosome segregation [Giardia duodenalis assemblage B]|uniref:ATPase involved in DNA repair/chromosome segregation n=1 Tax=Giardia duodenalis assemblage B TaxID=1394984 RepID=A0A132NQ36_GIAIN|nr:ATPase involved in DNA repair/chromosome segregation [Giardia intestinalis assemblage B]
MLESRNKNVLHIVFFRVKETKSRLALILVSTISCSIMISGRDVNCLTTKLCIKSKQRLLAFNVGHPIGMALDTRSVFLLTLLPEHLSSSIRHSSVHFLNPQYFITQSPNNKSMNY